MKLAVPCVRSDVCVFFHSCARDRAHNGTGRLSVCIYNLVILKLQLGFTFFGVHTNYEMQVLTGWVNRRRELEVRMKAHVFLLASVCLSVCFLALPVCLHLWLNDDHEPASLILCLYFCLLRA